MWQIARHCWFEPLEGQKRGEVVKDEKPKNKKKEGLKFYSCGEKGHTLMRCPSKALTVVDNHECGRNRCPMHRGMVDGQEVKDILLDTGCSRTMVHADLVPSLKFSGKKKIAIWCAHGDVVE